MESIPFFALTLPLSISLLFALFPTPPTVPLLSLSLPQSFSCTFAFILYFSLVAL